MKKLISLLLMAALVLTLFAGCGGDSTTSSDTSQTSGTVSDTASDTASDSSSETEEEPVTIRIGGLKGPTSIGMVKLMEDDENGEDGSPADGTDRPDGDGEDEPQAYL